MDCDVLKRIPIYPDPIWICGHFYSISLFYSGTLPHTPSLAFRHLPPNSARFGYATEGTLFISAQLSSDMVMMQRPPKGSGINKTVEAT